MPVVWQVGLFDLVLISKVGYFWFESQSLGYLTEMQGPALLAAPCVSGLSIIW